MILAVALMMFSPCAFPEAKNVGEVFECNDHKYYWDGAAWKAAKPLSTTSHGAFFKAAPRPTDCSSWTAQEVDGHCEMRISFPEARGLACMIDNDGYTIKCVWDKPKAP